MKNLQAKTRTLDEPYEVWRGIGQIGNDTFIFEWRVLKKWQIDDNKPNARWYCAVKSEATFGQWEYGDVYVSEIKRIGQRIG